MAVSSITITQDNISDEGVDLLSVHNPLVFLVEVSYSSEVPETLYTELQDKSGDVLETFSAIPYEDSESGSVRTFAFVASDILKAYMDEFEDYKSSEKVLEHVDGITQQFTLRFYIDDIEASVSFTAIHAARQFGETPYLEEVYNNEDETYYGGVGMPIYIYFYNASSDNKLTINTETASSLAALDYDDTVFRDSGDSYFKLE